MDKSGQQPKYQQIAETLRQAIRSGRYGPGDQLPPENKLMAEMGVARMTVRNAYAALREEGLVESRKGAGVFVCDPPPASPSAKPVPGVVVGQVLRELDLIQAAVDRLRKRLEAIETGD